MGADKPEDTRSDNAGFAAMWSSEGATRSFAPSDTGTGLPVDLPQVQTEFQSHFYKSY